MKLKSFLQRLYWRIRPSKRYAFYQGWDPATDTDFESTVTIKKDKLTGILTVINHELKPPKKTKKDKIKINYRYGYVKTPKPDFPMPMPKKRPKEIIGQHYDGYYIDDLHTPSKKQREATLDWYNDKFGKSIQENILMYNKSERPITRKMMDNFNKRADKSKVYIELGTPKEELAKREMLLEKLGRDLDDK